MVVRKITQLVKLFKSAWPNYCTLCAHRLTKIISIETSRYLCAPCYQTLPILPEHCRKCAQFLPNEASLCGACLHHPPAFDQLFALFPYHWPIPELIIALKFKARLAHAALFAELFINAMPSWYHDQPKPQVILPVPLHPSRLCARGFNQTVEIGKIISKACRIPLDLTGIQRIKATLAQTGLDKKARARNLMQAFSLTKCYANQHVVLLDDVVTTGATIAACAKPLQENGAKRIDIWCIARR